MTIQNSPAAYYANAAGGAQQIVQMRLQRMAMEQTGSQIQDLLQILPEARLAEPSKGQSIDIRV